VALAQERTSWEAPAPVERESASRRSTRTRRAPRATAQLASTVAQLRDVEDGIVSRATAADRLLAGLEGRRLHEDAGYTSRSEFERRMLGAAPFVQAIRELAVATPRPAGARAARRRTGDARDRRTHALTTVARTLKRIRALDEQIRDAAATAKARLDDVESRRLFDECGYASFEEFLERALGPSPVLATVLALLGDDTDNAAIDGAPAANDEATFQAPAAEPATVDVTTDAPLVAPGVDTDADDLPPALLGAPEPAPTADAAPTTSAAAAPAPVPLPAPTGAPRRARRLTLSAALCLAAAVAGGAAGAWNDIAAILADPGPPAASVAPTPSSAPRAATPAPAKPGPGSHALPTAATAATAATAGTAAAAAAAAGTAAAAAADAARPLRAPR